MSRSKQRKKRKKLPDDELEHAKTEIASLRFNPEKIISMTGLGHDWKKLLGYFEDNKIEPKHYFDIAYLLQNEKARIYSEKNNISQEDAYKINRLYQWNVPNIDRLLDADAPLEKLDNLQYLMGASTYDLSQLFSHLGYENGKFFLDTKDRAESDTELEKKVYNYKNILNADIDIKEINRTVQDIVAKEKEAIRDFELDSESEDVYRNIKDLPQFRGTENFKLKLIALNRDFCRKGTDFALEQQIPEDYFINTARDYELSEDSARYILERFGIENFDELFASHYKDPDAFEKGLQLIKGKEQIAKLIRYYVVLGKEGRSSLIKYLNLLPEETHADFIETLNKGRTDFKLNDFAIENGLLGYRSRMPVIQVSKPKKILEKLDQIIKKSYELCSRIRFKDIDFEENDELKKAVLKEVGKRKFVTVKDMDSICRNYNGFIKFGAAQLQDRIKGLHDKNLGLLAQQLSLNLNDLKKIAGSCSPKGYYEPEDIEQKLIDFSEMQKINIDAKEYGLSRIVEGEFKVFPTIRKSMFFESHNEYAFIMALYPNSSVIESLAEKDRILSEHHKDVIGYARCYIDGETIRVEELQSDIFDKQKKIPSSLKNKYHEWPKMIILALEHFALDAGYKNINISTSDLQIRKWSNHSGLRGITSYDVYTRTPLELGYSLEKTSMVYSEDTGIGMNMNDDFLSLIDTNNCETYNIMWVKELSMEDAHKHNRLFYMNKKEKTIRKKCMDLRQTKDRANDKPKNMGYISRRDINLFDDE